MNWNRLPLLDRIRWLRFVLPPVMVLWVVTYQLAFAQPLETAYGHTAHYSVEIAFYSLVGPVVTWLALTWVERNVSEKEQLEAQVRRVAQQKAAVLEEERARIARDLHDGAAQILYFLALKADMVRGQLQEIPKVAGELREMGQTTRTVIREIRRTIFALRPLDWAQGEFLPSLEQFVHGFSEQVAWQSTTAIDRHLKIPSALEPLLFRLVQESLNNVAKHADATRISVFLSAESHGHSLRLEIRDNGRGFDLQAEAHHGLGLQQMAARTAAAAGAFQVESSPDLGTTITAHLPFEDEHYE